MANKTNRIQEETGDTLISTNNALILSRFHGVLVGAIHRINPFGEHSTLLFYENGTVHEALGFTCGDIKEAGSAYLKAILGTIWGMAQEIEGTYIAELGQDEESQNYLKKDKLTLGFVFRAPDKFSIDLDFLSKGNRGLKAMDDSLEKISDEANTVLRADW